MKKMQQSDLLTRVQRQMRRRMGIARRASQDAALMGQKHLVDFHMGGYSMCACLLEDLERAQHRKETGSR